MSKTFTAKTAVWEDDGYHGPLVPVEYRLNETFETVDTSYQHLSGRPFTLLRVFDEPDELRDECVLPMFQIEIDGEVIDTFADEIATPVQAEEGTGA